MHKDLTYSEAIEKVIFDNGGYAPLKHIYDNIEKYRKKLVLLLIIRFKKEFKEILDLQELPKVSML